MAANNHYGFILPDSNFLYVFQDVKAASYRLRLVFPDNDVVDNNCLRQRRHSINHPETQYAYAGKYESAVGGELD